MSDSSTPSTDDMAAKLAIGAGLGLAVGAIGFLASEDIVVAVVAAVATVVAFWFLDQLLAAPGARTASSLAPGVPSGGLLPETGREEIPSGKGVAAPQVGEPLPSEAGAADPVEKQGATLDPALFDRQSVEIKTNSQAGNRVFSIRIAKHGNSIGECEDAVAVDPARSVLAVADGASSSFGANIWAATLAKQFVKTPPKPLSVASFGNWLDTARKASPEEAGSDDGDPNGWWSEQGARNGAFSTIVGAAIMADGANKIATVMCLGDSCAFVLTGAAGKRSLRRALPYEDASQFGSHPALVGSATGRPHDEPTWTTVPIAAGDLLVLASDAVSEWLLGDPNRFAFFDGTTPDEIAKRIVDERTAGRIVNDDMTLALIEVGVA